MGNLACRAVPFRALPIDACLASSRLAVACLALRNHACLDAIHFGQRPPRLLAIEAFQRRAGDIEPLLQDMRDQP